MEADAPVEVAPLQPSAPVIESALDKAVSSGDMAAFREAKRAKPEAIAATPAVSDAPAVDVPAEDAETAKIPADQRVTDPETGDVLDRRTRAGKRIVSLLGKTKSLEARIAELTAQLSKPAEKAPEPTKQAAPADDEPQLASFDTYEDWIKSWTRWSNKQQVAEALASEKASQQKTAHEREQADRLKATSTREAAFQKDHPDYLEIVGPFVAELNTALARQHPTALAMSDFLRESDQGPALAYHLGRHPEVVARLAALPPSVALVELGAELASLKAPAAPPPVITPSAPKPPMTLGSKSTGPIDEIEAAVTGDDMVAFKAAKQRLRAASLR